MGFLSRLSDSIPGASLFQGTEESRFSVPQATQPNAGVQGDMMGSAVLFGGDNKKTVVHSDARSLTAYAGAVKIMSMTLASLPWKVYKDNIEERDNIWRLLNLQPNSDMSANFMRTQVVRELFYHGNSLVRIEFDKAGEVRALHWMPRERVYIERTNAGMFYVFYPYEGGAQTYQSYEVLHFRTNEIHTDTRIGVSPIQQFASTFGEIRDTQALARKYAERGGRLSGVIEAPNVLGDKKAKAVATMWRRNYLTSNNTGGVGVLDEGMKYTEMVNSLKDSQHVEVRGFQVAEISRITMVPPHLLASLDRATFNNIYELSIAFVRYGMMPFTAAIEAEVLTKLYTRKRQIHYRTEHDFSRLTQASPKERGEYYRSMVGGGIWTPDEARIDEGKTPKGGAADGLFLQVNMAKMEDIGKIPAVDEPANGGTETPKDEEDETDDE